MQSIRLYRKLIINKGLMFRRLWSSTLYASAGVAALKFQQKNRLGPKWSLALPLGAVSMLARNRLSMYDTINQKIEKAKPQGMFSYLSYIWRSFQLMLIFLPSIILLPLVIFKFTRVIWMNCFVWSISKAGVVWIKVFQHMSHRGDVIG